MNAKTSSLGFIIVTFKLGRSNEQVTPITTAQGLGDNRRSTHWKKSQIPVKFKRQKSNFACTFPNPKSLNQPANIKGIPGLLDPHSSVEELAYEQVEVI
jgi:hypothetical protein